MKNRIKACILMIAVLAPISAFAEVDSEPRQISVSGGAEVRVVLNEIVFTLDVETSNTWTTIIWR